MFDLQKELNAHLFADAGWEGQRLINTAKVLRGNKLHAKEQAKIWLLKNKHIANRSAQFTEENLCTIRRNQFSEKYRALKEITDKKEIIEFIEKQRTLQSRGSKTRSKLFNNANHLEYNQCELTNKHDHKQDKVEASLAEQETIGDDSILPVTETPRKTLLQKRCLRVVNPQKDMAVAFYSDNIGKRMNEYLNLVLKKKIAQDERVIQEFLSEMRGNKVAEGQQADLSLPLCKKTYNSHLKKMKSSMRHKDNRCDPNATICEGELVKMLLKQAPKSILKNQARDTFNTSYFYSLQLRKKQSNEKQKLFHTSFNFGLTNSDYKESSRL